MESLRSSLHALMEQALQPLARALARRHITPNQVSILGMLLNLMAAVLIVGGHPIAAGIIFVIAGLFDLLDGTLARLGHSASPQGAFLDSTLDRISEGLVFAAIAYVLAGQGRAVDAALVVLVLLGSMLVSYTRARAAALGVECKVGLATRAERVILIAVGLLFGVLTPVLYVLLALTAITVAERIFYTLNQLRERE